MLNQQEAIALVDSCLDGQLRFGEIVEKIQDHTDTDTYTEGANFVIASDVAVKSLQASKHPMALIMLHRIKTSIARYQGLVLPNFSEVLDDGS